MKLTRYDRFCRVGKWKLHTCHKGSGYGLCIDLVSGVFINPRFWNSSGKLINWKCLTKLINERF